MNRMKSSEIDENILDKIISVAYGDAGPVDRIIVSRFARHNPRVKELLAEYSETAKKVRDLDIEECPQAVIRKAESLTGAEFKNQKSFIADLMTLVFSRPVVSLAASVVLVAAVFSTIFLDRHTTRLNFTSQEIEAADKQIREALKIVGGIFESTNRTLRNEILTEKVSKPVNEGMKVVNQLFEKENKNEIN